MDELFIPFIFSGSHLSLLCMPFGAASPDTYIKVLKKCLDICSLQNGNKQRYTYVKWVTENQERFLQQSTDFSAQFKARPMISTGPEYHYSIRELLKLEGKRFGYLIRKTLKFRRDHATVDIRKSTPSDYLQLLELNNKWLTEARNRLGTMFDSAYYPAVLRHHDNLGLIVLVAEDKDSIVGMISGALTQNGQSHCFSRKSLREFYGLAETLTLSLANAIHAQDNSVELINDGGTGSKPGLTEFKGRFRPRLLVNRSRLYVISLRILQQTAYR